ncbi:hypothetical protein [Vibrio tubiashii]|uniref:hypothetical protein n=1 Tax=Vibrio tubiashii TaxID=29498 RepID=UPI00349E99D0
MYSNFNAGNYTKIVICDSKYLWDKCALKFTLEDTLFLTFDFKLFKYINDVNGNCLFLDHLNDSEYMQKENHNIYRFFKEWHFSKDGEDLFNYKGVDFGMSFRLEYWNDFVYYCRLVINLSLLKEANEIHVITNDDVIISILNFLRISFSRHHASGNDDKGMSSFFFPIAYWLDSKVRPKGKAKLLYLCRELLNNLHYNIFRLLDIFGKNSTRKRVYIQEYHPTKPIIEKFLDDKEIIPILGNVSKLGDVKRLAKIRVMPARLFESSYKIEAEKIRHFYESERYQKLVLRNGLDISDLVYKVIDDRVYSCLEEYISILDDYIKKVELDDISLNVLVANIGKNTTLFDCVCRAKNIESYLVANGLLTSDYLDEGTFATYINSYSNTIREYYFKSAENVYALGDPRMDSYKKGKNLVRKNKPRIVIGASGFNSIDLNSYVAVEFDFMFDVLKSIIESDNYSEIIIKARANGYRSQYENFVNQYFSNVSITIEDTIPMLNVLQKADLYISIYSQTLFEASMLGIPCIYYRKDNEVMCPPFDGKSELVTACSANELLSTLKDFETGHERFNDFLNPKVMEKYVGSLDGKNLARNVDFIRNILNGG